jgi:transcriptional regulator with XRE-family HTH domain
MKKKINLRGIRKQSGLTIEQVSLDTGIPFSTIQALEKGRGKKFSLITKHTLTDYFGVGLFKAFPEDAERFKILKTEFHKSKK